jgi:hypothetical protein
MKVYIIGGGPSGLFTSIICTHLGIPCEIYEKNSYIGGHHHVDEENDTMHAPRLLSWDGFKNVQNVLKSIGMNETNTCLDNYVFNTRILKHCNLIDNIKLWYAFTIDYPLRCKQLFKISAHDYFEKLFGNGTCKKYTSLISAFIAASSENAPVVKILDGISSNIYFYEKSRTFPTDNDWIRRIETWLVSKNVRINKETTIDDFVLNSSKTKIQQFSTNGHVVELNKDDKIAMCMDPEGIIELLENSIKEVQDNWMPWGEFKHVLGKSTYKSIGFRIDFSKNGKRANISKWDAREYTDWEILLKMHNKHSNSMNGVMCDLMKISKYTGKTADETPPDELKNEIKRQLENADPSISIINVIIHKDVWFNSTTWKVSHSAAALHADYGFIPSKGKIGNLNIVNSLIERTFPITTIETCCEVAINYVNSLSSNKFKVVRHGNYELKNRIVIFIVGAVLPLIILIKITSILAKQVIYNVNSSFKNDKLKNIFYK